MAELTLKPKELNTLRVNIGEESFQIPLRGSLNIKEALGLDTEEGTYSFFKHHVPEKVFKELTVDELNQIITVWKEESDKHTDKTLGELRASLKK